MNFCLTCKHWQGDKAATYKRIALASFKTVMNTDRGYPDDGECGISGAWADIIIDGNATATLEVPGNFGCIMHEEDE